jgi:HEAT repeat protein
MGLLVRSTKSTLQARQLNWFGRGMSRTRMWESAHPRLRKLEYVPFVGAGALAVIDQFASVLLTSGEAGCVVGGLLLANIVFRSATYYARRIDLEGNMNKMSSLPGEERLRYCYAIFLDKEAHTRSRAVAVKMLSEETKVNNYAFWSECISMMELGERPPKDELSGAVFTAMVRDYAGLLSSEASQKGLVEAPDRFWFGEEKNKRELRKLLREHWDKLAELKSLVAPVLEPALKHQDVEVNKAAAEALLEIGEFADEFERDRIRAYIDVGNGDWDGAVALGAAAIPALEKELWGEDGERSKAAAGALGKMGAAAVPALKKRLEVGWRNILKTEAGEHIIKAVVEALVKIADPAAIGVLVKALGRGYSHKEEAIEIDGWDGGGWPLGGGEVEDVDINIAIAEALGRIGNASAIPALDEAQEHWNKGVRAAATAALSRINESTTEVERAQVRARAYVDKGNWDKAFALGSAALPALEKAIPTLEVNLRVALAAGRYNEAKEIMKTLGEIGDKIGSSRAISALIKEEMEKAIPTLEVNLRAALASGRYDEAKEIIEMADKVGSSRAISALRKVEDAIAVVQEKLQVALASNRCNEAKAIIEMLGMVGNSRVTSALTEAKNHRHHLVRDAAKEALKKIKKRRA